MTLKRKFIAVLIAVTGLALLPGTASALRFDNSPAGPIAFPSPDNVVNDIAIADLNGDGNDDIVKVGATNKIHVFLADNDGNGFHTAPGGPFGTDSTVEYKNFVYAGDFGGDSATDLLVGNNAVFEVFLGNGAGTFPSSSSFFSGLLIGGSVPGNPTALSDVNHDGHPDLISAGNSHTVYVALGTGNVTGTFTAAPGSPFNVPTANNNSGDSFWQITVGDFDGNSDPDLALLNKKPSEAGSPDGIYVAYGSGNGTFSAPPTGIPVATAGAGEQIYDVAAIDLTGGGTNDDLAYSISSESAQMNEVRTMVGTGSGLIPNEAADGKFAFNYATTSTDLVVTDVNGDLRDDIIVLLGLSTKVGVLLSNGDETVTLAPGDVIRVPDELSGLPTFPNSLKSGDFNGDGFPDFAVTSGHSGAPSYGRGVLPMVNVPDPVLSAASFDFAVTRPLQTSATKTFTLFNEGAPPLEIDDVNITGDTGEFDWDYSGCPEEVLSGESCSLSVKFKPTTHGSFSSVLHFTFGTGGDTISVSGETGTDATPNPTSGTFGEVVTNYEAGAATQNFTITSTGGSALTLGAPEITGNDAQFFSVISNNCPASLPKPQSCIVTVKLAPTGTANGFVEGKLEFPDSNLADPLTIALGGYARQADYMVTPESQDFGSAEVGNGLNRTSMNFTVSASGAIGLPINGVAINGPDADSFSITSNDCPPVLALTSECTIGVAFDPSTGSAGARSATLDIAAFSSTKASPSIPLTGIATVTPAGKPKLSVKLKAPKKAKAGKKAVVKVTVRNSGTAASGPFTLQASAPAKLTGKVKDIRSQPMGRGKSITKTFRIPVKKTAKGRFKVKVKLIPQGKTKPLLTTSTPFISVWGSTNKPG